MPRQIDSISLAGDSVTTSVVFATAVNVAIPTNAEGGVARMVLIVTDALVGYKPIAAVAETPALGVLARHEPGVRLVVNTKGYSHIRLDKVATGTALVTLTPLENQ